MMLLKLGLFLLACMLVGGIGQSVGARICQSIRCLLVLVALGIILVALTIWQGQLLGLAVADVGLFFMAGLGRGSSEDLR